MVSGEEIKMSIFIATCPRCNTENMTFDLTKDNLLFIKYGWQRWYEAFCICRHCKKATIFRLSQRDNQHASIFQSYKLAEITDSINDYMTNEGFVCIKDMAAKEPPEHLPQNIDDVFREGAVCMAVNCFNAAGTMFRLCIDLSTRSMLPKDNVNGLNNQIRRNLGLRLPWLFDNKKLPEALQELSECIKDDGNDGAHEGNLTEDEVEDLLDLTHAMLERIYTEPERLKLAKERRIARHKKN
jgi:hypothetical protein